MSNLSIEDQKNLQKLREEYEFLNNCFENNLDAQDVFELESRIKDLILRISKIEKKERIANIGLYIIK